MDQILILLKLIYDAVAYGAGLFRRGAEMMVYTGTVSLTGSATGQLSIKIGENPNGWVVREIVYESTSDLATVGAKRQSSGKYLTSGQGRIATLFRKGSGTNKCSIPPFEIPGGEEFLFDFTEQSTSTNAVYIAIVCQKL